jgi:hypothetical protein
MEVVLPRWVQDVAQLVAQLPTNFVASIYPYWGYFEGLMLHQPFVVLEALELPDVEVQMGRKAKESQKKTKWKKVPTKEAHLRGQKEELMKRRRILEERLQRWRSQEAQ